MKRGHHPRVWRALRRQAGLSIIELMLAIGLGMVVLTAIGAIFIGSMNTYRLQEANARLQEGGRFALEVIGRSLRQAGADGNLTGTSITTLPERSLAELPCVVDGVNCQVSASPNPLLVGTACAWVEGVCVATNRSFALQGIDGAAGAADRFAVQYFGQIGGTRDCVSRNVGADELVTEVYALNGTDLRCNNGTGTGGVQPLLSDVEDMQILYGIDTDGDQTANVYSAAPSGAFPIPADRVHWNNVVSARVCVMLRSAEEGFAPAGQRPLDCVRALDPDAAAASAVRNDTRLYRTFVATFNLRNRVTNLP